MSAAKWFRRHVPAGRPLRRHGAGGGRGRRRHPGPGWGLDLGEMIGFVFLVNLLLTPISQLSEILDQTQTAIAGWRKILGVLATLIDVGGPRRRPAPCPPALPDAPGGRPLRLPRGGGEVLRGLDLDVPAGTNVAVVGETGSGKTTVAKLLCRLADPTVGRVVIGGIDLREVDATSRAADPRWSPRTGSFRRHPRRERAAGRTDPDRADDAEAARAPRLPRPGLGRRPPRRAPRRRGRARHEPVGRASASSSRSPGRSSATPACSILDEATSSVDPETEQALADEPQRHGRGTHRDQHRPPPPPPNGPTSCSSWTPGEIVERGSHTEPRRPRRRLRPALREPAGQHPGLSLSPWLSTASTTSGASSPSTTGWRRCRRCASRRGARQRGQRRHRRPPRRRRPRGGLRVPPWRPASSRTLQVDPTATLPVAGRVGLGHRRGPRGRGRARRPGSPRPLRTICCARRGGDEHGDQAEYDRVMAAGRRCAVLPAPHRGST